MIKNKNYAECESCGDNLYSYETVYEVEPQSYVCDKKECLSNYFDAQKVTLDVKRDLEDRYVDYKLQEHKDRRLGF